MSTLQHSLEVRNLTKRYGQVAAVRNASLTVERGEFLTLLGPSGSGKTTILMAIAGFVAPTAGDILLDGKPITYLTPEKRNFGMVFQGYALFPHLNVFDNVAFSLKARRWPRSDIERAVKDTLELVQLQGLEARLPRHLSGGQQQRVAVARALIFQPDVLLFDEPLSALDKKLRTELQWELKSLHRRIGHTIVYVTHDQGEALSMSDKVAILRDGIVVQTGSPSEVYERPTSRFVADFLGESNFLEGTIENDGSESFVYRCRGLRFVQRDFGTTRTAGQDVLVALRPEKIDVAIDGPPQRANVVEGRLADWSYSGSEFQFIVVSEALGPLKVSAPVWRSTVSPSLDRPVWLAWDADASIVMSGDEPTSLD